MFVYIRFSKKKLLDQYNWSTVIPFFIHVRVQPRILFYFFDHSYKLKNGKMSKNPHTYSIQYTPLYAIHV